MRSLLYDLCHWPNTNTQCVGLLYLMFSERDRPMGLRGVLFTPGSKHLPSEERGLGEVSEQPHELGLYWLTSKVSMLRDELQSWALKRHGRCWRDDSVIKSTNYSSKGPRLNSQHPYDGSQPSITSVQRVAVPRERSQSSVRWQL